MIPAFSYFSIYISFCLFFTSHGFLFKGVVFRRLSKADDKLLQSRPLVEYTDISSRRCGLKCFNHHLCSSFFINKEKKVCKLAEEVDLNKMIHSPGYLYYVSEDCKRSDLGWEYRGSRDRTVLGIPCQRWDQQYPRTHSYKSLSGEQNFCRNPAKAYARRPWCYTTAGNDAWGYCFVPKCVTPARECLETKRGEEYFGTINRTISGRQCMRWEDRPSGNQSYSSLKAEGNYCRNPFAEKSAPWCYITKYRNEFEICDIPIC